MEGNEALARGAIAAGCNFFAGYPITPATTIFNNMLRMLPPRGGICLQGEDEIASMGYCIGASIAGRKALTATSGPGISLYSEHISFALGSETPLVIVDVQRLGPSTGSATRGADSDIQFLRWGSTGGVPVIVLAPTDVTDCYVLAAHAFNYAEEFRCPVFIASNKEIGLTKQSVDLENIDLPPVIERKRFTGKTYLPFAAAPGSSPPFLPVGGKTLVRITSSTHGPDGYITTDPVVIAQNNERLRDKIDSAGPRITLFEADIKEHSEILIISYGITSCAVAEAVKVLAQSGVAVSTLTLKTLWPVPEQLLKEKGGQFRRVIVFEMNLGQYVREIRRVLCDKEVEFFGQMDGVLISPRKVTEVIGNG